MKRNRGFILYHFSPKSDKGFTLIEALVYIALFGIMISGIVLSAFALFESTDRNQTKAMLQEEKNFLLAKIDWAVSDVQDMSQPPLPVSPATTTSDGMLALTKYDGTPVTISLSGTDMQFATTGPAHILNNSDVSVSNLVFIHTYVSATSPESIEAGFTVTARMSNGLVLSQTASTTRYIRK